MKHLVGPFWFASRDRFVEPGLYFCRNGNKRIVPLPKRDSERDVQLIEFAEQTVIIAKDQPEYRPLPAYVFVDDPNGRIACCWKLSWRSRLKVLFTGRIWHEILTFKQPLQPQLLVVDKPDMPAAR